MCGPLSLFGVNAPDSHFTRAQLLGADLKSSSWQVASQAAPVEFKAFPDIRHEKYRLYYEVPS
jgi:hypothetical protein